MTLQLTELRHLHWKAQSSISKSAPGHGITLSQEIAGAKKFALSFFTEPRQELQADERPEVTCY